MSDEFEINEHEGEYPAPATSLLANLRKRREQAIETLYVDIEHPEWPEFAVRFRPVAQEFVKGIALQVDKSKAPDAELVGAVKILVQYCIGVYEKDDNGDPIGDPSEWPGFDTKLAEVLGISATRALDIVKGFYLKDGNIFSVQAALVEWSGYSREAAREEYAGN